MRSWFLRAGRVRTILLALPLLVAAISAFTPDVRIFGPETFTRQSGKPQTVTRTVRVAKASDTYTLRVTNHGVTSAIITINGRVVFGPDDFGREQSGSDDQKGEHEQDSSDSRRRARPQTLERSIALQAGANALAVELRGTPGQSLTIEVFAPAGLVDTTPPAIAAAVSPSPNANGWNNSDATVTFTCTDADSGVATCPAPVTVSTETPGQVVSGTATDNAGNTATASATVKLDKTVPGITVALSPAPNADGSVGGPVTAHFTCTDAGSGINVCPADQVVSAEGVHAGVSGTATDQAGNSASVTSPGFTIDLTPPQISVSLSPAANADGWNNTPVTAHFTCSDSGSGIATCPADQVVSNDGTGQTVSGTAVDKVGRSTSVTSAAINLDQVVPTITVELTPAPTSGFLNTPTVAHFSCADTGSGVAACPADQFVTSAGADQKVTGTVTDKAGNTATVTSATFGIDATPPTIVATVSPAPNRTGWNTGPVTVHFECSDPGSGIASCPADQTVLAEGKGQVVRGTAVDKAGNSAEATATVNIDSTSPSVAVSAGTGTLFTPSTSLKGLVTDSGSGVSSVACNGVPGSLTGSSFECAVGLTVGTNAIEVVATDAAGNTSSASTSLRYVRVPKVTITTPASLDYLNISPTTVSGTVDDSTATVTINSIPAPVAGGVFSIALPLAEGPNLIAVTATAGSGAVGAASLEVTLDTTPPHVTITSPADGFVTADASISIAGSVNDLVVGTVNEQQAQVTINGGAAQVANRTFLATDVALAPGRNVIRAVARDRVGNAATTQITVVRQTLVQRQIHLVSGNNQSAAIGSVLGTPLVVSVVDAADQPVANQKVIFKVTQNDGLLAAAGDAAATVLATTDGQGRAQARWTLGHRSGAGGNVAEAYAVGFEGTAVFTATGLQAQAGKIVVDTGNDQLGAINEPLPKPFIAVVVDEGNNRLAGVPVTFRARQGGGTFGGQPEVTVGTDSDGRAAATLTLGLQEGNANNVVEATFPGNTAFPASFRASGRALGNPADTTIAGVVLDNSNAPIPGVTVRAVLTNAVHASLLAVGSATAVQTDAQGQFTIANAPVGFVKLMVDGTTAQSAGTYPSLEYDLVTVAGQINTTGQPIYLVPLNTANQLCVTQTTGGGTLTVPEAPGFSLTFGPGQVTFPGGAKSGCVSVTVVNGDKVPMVPGFGQQPRFIVTIQPSGAVFNPPAPITLPNVDGLKPREVTEMYSFDHDIGSFVAIGTGVVSNDGRVIRSSTGVGVLKAGWHCGGNPSTTGTAATCPTCQTCNGTQCDPDDGQTPPQTPNDCKQDKCSGGGVVSVNDDSDHDSNTCCYNGSTIPKQPIADLSQCPNRVAGPWNFEYDGCSLQPLPGFFRNNPAGGISTLFSDDHLPNPTHQYACDEHDRCYQTCAGNDLAGGQEGCDLKLRNIALSQCTQSLLNPLDVLTGASTRCFGFAVAYYEGLSGTGLGLGKGPYADRQKQVCKCCQ
jgi:glucodextranase-like protein